MNRLLLLLILYFILKGLWYLINNPAKKLNESVFSEGEKPHELRDLTKAELRLLTDQINRAKVAIAISILPLIFCLSVGVIHATYSTLNVTSIINFLYGIPYMISTGLSLFLVLEGYNTYQRLTADKKTKIYKVTGKVFIFKQLFLRYPRYIVIQKIIFRLHDPANTFAFKFKPWPILEQLNTYKNGDSLEIEYSPISKHIWRVTLHS